MRNALIMVGLGALVLAGGWWYLAQMNTETAINPRAGLPLERSHEEVPPASFAEQQGASIGEENTVEFSCEGGKGFTAVFARDIVALTLDDGRQITLRQIETEPGEVKYLDNSGTIEFHAEEHESHIHEGGRDLYRDCQPRG